MQVLDPVEQYAVEARADQVRFASGWLEQSAQQRGVPAQQISRLELCLNETLANVIAHGGDAARTAPVLLALEFSQDAAAASATLIVSDAGAPFNPCTAVTRPRPVALDKAEPGGLGLTMMRSACEVMGYHRAAGRNHLSFTVRWVAAPLSGRTP